MTVTAHNATTPRKQRVKTPSLVIIEFVLDQLPHRGTAGQLLHLSLMQNYVVERDRIHYEDIYFELNSPGALEKHTKRVEKVIKKLQTRYLDRCGCFSTTQNKITGVLTMLCSSSTPIPMTPQVTCGTAPLMPNQRVLQLHRLKMYFPLCSNLALLISFSSFLRQSLVKSRRSISNR